MQQETFLNSPNPNSQSNFPYLVLKVDKCRMEPLTRGFRIAHWHNDLQFTYVRSGQITWHTLSNNFTLHAGEGVFFNSKTVHMTRSDYDSSYTNLLFPSRFLGFYPDSPLQKQLHAIIGNPNLPLLTFQPDIPWQKDVLDKLEHLLELENQKDAFYPWHVLEQLNNLWLTLCSHVPVPTPEQTNRTTRRMEQFIDYLHQHYQEDFSYEELSAAAHVSKAECLRCFHSILNTTPYKYLTELRIARSSELLQSTDLPITTIANQVGFNQTSNFDKIFKEKMGCTPKEYRKFHASP